MVSDNKAQTFALGSTNACSTGHKIVAFDSVPAKKLLSESDAQRLSTALLSDSPVPSDVCTTCIILIPASCPTQLDGILVMTFKSKVILVSMDESERGQFYIVESDGTVWLPTYNASTCLWSKPSMSVSVRLHESVSVPALVHHVVHIRDRNVFAWIQTLKDGDIDALATVYARRIDCTPSLAKYVCMHVPLPMLTHIQAGHVSSHHCG